MGAVQRDVSPLGDLAAGAKRALMVVGALCIVAAAALLAGYLWGSGRARAKARAELQAVRHVVDSLEAVKVRVSVVYRTDTLQLVRWRTHWDSVRVRDTVWVDSVVYVPRDVADSTIAACTLALRDCDHIRAVNDSLVAVLEAPRSAPRACEDRKWGVWTGVGPGVALDGRARVTFSVSVGRRIF